MRCCKKKVLLPVVVLFLFLTASASWPADYVIEKVKGDVYRFTDARHHALFLVDEEGILLTDPLNENAALWLDNELEKRFNRPIRYVVFSHNHSDHIYGAGVFKKPGTVFVAHELAKQDIESTRADTIVPEIAFRDEMTVVLGDHTVELRYHGPNDGRGSISILIRPEKVLFVVDWIVLGRMPWKKLWSYDIQGMINATDEVLDLDFDLFVGGHADMGRKPEVQRYRQYLQALYNAVIDGIHAGKSLEQLKKEIRLEGYNDLKHYEEWLPLNIEGVYERLMEESGLGWRPDLKR